MRVWHQHIETLGTQIYVAAQIDEGAFLSPVDFDDGVLVDVLEYVRGVHEDT